MNKSWSLKGRNNKISYINLEITNRTREDACLRADKDNKKKYSIIVNKAEKTNKKWNITGAIVNIEIPKPPDPSNHDRYISFKKNSILKPCYLQSRAILFLYKRGFELDKDYKAHEAIHIYNKTLEKIKSLGINEENIIQNHIIAFLNQKDNKNKNNININISNNIKLPNIKRNSSNSYLDKLSSFNNDNFGILSDDDEIF